MQRSLSAVFGIALAVLGGSELYAACGVITPMIHSGTILLCADDTVVTGYSYQMNNPTATNTGSVDIVCEHTSDTCLGATDNPGEIDIETDWSTPGVIGCPWTIAPLLVNRVVIAVQAADGRGAVLSIIGTDGGFYSVDNAHQVNEAGDAILPIACDDTAGKPSVARVTTSTVDVTFKRPRLWTDCDPNSLGALFGACTDSFAGGDAQLGRIFTSIQPCSTRPDVRLAAWTAINPVLNPTDGSFTVPYTKPPSDACFYIGSTLLISGQESSGITGFVRVAGTLAASPKALNVRARQAGGDVVIDFNTATEGDLTGFDIVTAGKGRKLNTEIIAAKSGVEGVGASYTVTLKRGTFQNERQFYVKALLGSGNSVNSDPASF